MNVQETVHWKNILTNVVSGPLTGFLDYYPELKTKDMSCNVSAILTIEAARYFNSINMTCLCERLDSDPDLYFSELDQNVEIKTTRAKSGVSPKWQGGTYSKRSGLHILVAWDKINMNLDGAAGYSFYVTSCQLNKTEWKRAGEDYYATNIFLKDLLDKKNIIGNEFAQEFFALPS